jgi:hypothetical protein
VEPAADRPAIKTGTSAEEYAGLVTVLISSAAAIAAPNWKITAEESKAIGDAAGPVLVKYFPDANPGPEMALLLTVGMVILPRLSIPRKLEEPAQNG